jgi:hypothetical protein
MEVVRTKAAENAKRSKINYFVWRQKFSFILEFVFWEPSRIFINTSYRILYDVLVRWVLYIFIFYGIFIWYSGFSFDIVVVWDFFLQYFFGKVLEFFFWNLFLRTFKDFLVLLDNIHVWDLRRGSSQEVFTGGLRKGSSQGVFTRGLHKGSSQEVFAGCLHRRSSQDVFARGPV